MCVPALAGAAPILSGLSTAASIGGTFLGAIQERQAAKANEQIAKRDQIIGATQNTLQQRDIVEERRRLAGQQRVAAVAGGRGFTGSVLDVVTASNRAAEQDILATQFAGNVNEARGRGNRRVARFGGQGAFLGAGLRAGGTLLTAGSRILR